MTGGLWVASSPVTDPLRGIWVDDPPSLVLSTPYLDDLSSLGIHTAAVMVSRSGREWRPSWSAGQLRMLCRDLIARDIEVVLTGWPSPRRGSVTSFVDLCADTIPAGVSAIETDLEAQWGRDDVLGFASLEAAAEHLSARLAYLRETHDVRIEVTTFPGHAEHHEEREVILIEDRFVSQQYSVRNRPGADEPTEWGHRYGPGRMQRWARGRVPDGPKLSIGLAAWSQRWPGHRPEEAMRVAYEAALEAEPVEVRWWSSKHIIGWKRNPYAADFIRSIAASAAPVPLSLS